MIIDLNKFIATEKPCWNELENIMALKENDPYRRMSFEEIRRLHYLYQRASADLAKINTFSAEVTLRTYLESLVGRAYSIIYGSQQKTVRFAPVKWFGRIFPRTFRRHWRAFALSFSVMLAGCIFGAAAIVIDPEAKAVLMPFEHLQMSPEKRVAMEESAGDKDRLKGAKGSFSAFLMTHNIRVSIFVLALGMTFGIGTIVLLFSNGVMLGAVAADYLKSGQGLFLFGWLLPHGAVEIPSILIAGQAGLVLAGALIRRSEGRSMTERLQIAGPDIVSLISGVAVMLVWAGVVEGFFSQYHAPVMPYPVKIAFGVLELFLLVMFFYLSGRRKKGRQTQKEHAAFVSGETR